MSDLRATLRQLRQSPAHIAACLLSLSAGMAICVAVFSAFNAMVFEPIPGVRDRQQLVQLRWGDGSVTFSPAEIQAIDAAMTGFSSTAAESTRVLPAALPSGPAAKLVAFASVRYFDTLQTRAAAGRLLDARDANPAAAPAAVISDALWRQAFGADPATIGRPITVGGITATIVGVAPAGFPGIRLRDVGQTDGDFPQIWLPTGAAPIIMRSAASPAARPLMVLGRLRSGATVRAAQAELAIIGTRLATQSTARRRDGMLRGLRFGLDWSEDAGLALMALALYLFIPTCVLAIGCANVINLQLARATERARELSVRMALGASRARLARLLTLEIVLLATAAGVLGWLGATLLLAAMQPWFPAPLSIDRRVSIYVLVLVSGTIAAGGLFPGWLASRDVVAAGLKEQAAGGMRQRRLRSVLVVFQIAACVALLFLTGLAVRSLQAAARLIPAGAAGTLVADVDLSTLPHGQPSPGDFVDAVDDTLRSQSAVSSAGIADFFGIGGGVRYWMPSDGIDAARAARGGFVTGGWFESMGVRLLAGQPFASHDPASVVVSESFAALTGASVTSILGAQLRIAHADTGVRPVRIVGVVSNLVPSSAGVSIPMIFLPMPRSAPAALVLTVRAGDIATALKAARAAVSYAAPDAPLMRTQSVRARYEERSGPLRATTRIGMELGALALVLAMAGLYAVMAYAVRRRTREIGIRMAVGATLPQILTLVLRQGFALTVLGVAVGSAAAIPLAFLMRSIFQGISPVDPRALLSTGALLAAAALTASLVPAWRAARVNPIASLRDN